MTTASASQLYSPHHSAAHRYAWLRRAPLHVSAQRNAVPATGGCMRSLPRLAARLVASHRRSTHRYAPQHNATPTPIGGTTYDDCRRPAPLRDASHHGSSQRNANAAGIANSAIEAARGRAQSVRLEAEQQAAAILLKGQAEAKAQDLMAEALAKNAVLVDYQKALRWNGVLPQNVYAGAPIPFLQAGH